MGGVKHGYLQFIKLCAMKCIIACYEKKRGNSLTEVAPYNIMYEKKLIIFGS